MKMLKVENCPSHCTTPSAQSAANNDYRPVKVKVGCLHLNPASVRGRRQYMFQMLVLSFLPHAALIMQNCTIMAQLSNTMDAAIYLHSQLSTTLSLGDTTAVLQSERVELAFTLLGNFQGPNISYKIPDRNYLDQVFTETTAKLMEMKLPKISDKKRGYLYSLGLCKDNRAPLVSMSTNFFYLVHSHKLFSYIRRSVDKGKKASSRISIYEDINSEILVLIAQQVKKTTSSSWRLLSAYYELLKTMEETTLTMATNVLLLGYHEDDFRTQALFQKHQDSALEHLEFTIQFLEAENIKDVTSELKAIQKIYRYENLEKFYSENEENTTYKSQIQILLDDKNFLKNSKNFVERLKKIMIKVISLLSESTKREVWVARRTLIVGIVILVIVLLVSPTLILMIRHTIITIQAFTKSIELSTQQMIAEKQKSDLLLSRMLPKTVLKRLRAQRMVPAEAFDSVTIFFSDIVGFTNISANSTPIEIINMLNMLYTLFDNKILKFNVYKVETIGDAYMVVSGLPEKNGIRHASEIADMSLSLMRGLEGATVPHRPLEPLRIRVGINTGPCVAGVVGTTMPRYCLFGDTINTASRMESTGEAMKIHISKTTKKVLDDIGGYHMQLRGEMEVSGKGTMETFWLLGKEGLLDQESPRNLKLIDYDEQLVELLIR